MSSSYISGFHAIEEHLKAGKSSVTLLVGPKPGPRTKAILELAKKRGLRTKMVETTELDKLSGNNDHRGVLLQVDGTASEGSAADTVDLRTALEKLAKAERRDPAKRYLILALDSITDPHNLGAILRSADQFGVDLVLLPERRAAHESETVMRSSAGASAHVKTVVVTNLGRALDQCRVGGFWVIGADMQGTPIDKFDAKRDIVLVMGSEGKGLGRLISDNCDEIVSIPAKGKIDSLNVSVATGVLLYELRRQQDFGF